MNMCTEAKQPTDTGKTSARIFEVRGKCGLVVEVTFLVITVTGRRENYYLLVFWLFPYKSSQEL